MVHIPNRVESVGAGGYSMLFVRKFFDSRMATQIYTGLELSVYLYERRVKPFMAYSTRDRRVDL